MTRDELIAALEAATGRDRELDAKIWHLIGLTTSDEAHCVDWCGNGGRTDLTRDRYIAAWARPYTSSIDAALTLVQDGWEWLRKSELSVTVYRVPDDDKTWARHIDGAHKTPAIALCIAALKART